jgi:MFS family permease
MGVTMALISSILPTVARRGGLAPIGLSALAAAPFVANLLGAFAGRFGPRNTAQLGLVRGLGAAALLVLFLVPPAPVVVAVALVFWLSISFGGPFHLRLWGAMYPARLRGRVVGVLGMGRAAAGALAAFIGGVLADVIGGEQAVAIAGIVGVACAIGYLGLRAAAAEQPRSYSARESIRALRDRPALSRIAVAQGFYGGGLIAASPLFALVHVDRLNLSLADVGVIGILTAVATTVAFPLWGLVADRFGAVAALRTGSAIGLLSLVGYAVAPSVVVLWFAAIAAGIASASIDVGIAAAVSDQTPLASRAAAMAGWNALTGARGIVAAFLMSALLQIGLIDVTVGLLACTATSAIGVAMFVRAGRVVPAPDVRTASAPAVAAAKASVPAG